MDPADYLLQILLVLLVQGDLLLRVLEVYCYFLYQQQHRLQNFRVRALGEEIVGILQQLEGDCDVMAGGLSQPHYDPQNVEVVDALPFPGVPLLPKFLLVELVSDILREFGGDEVNIGSVDVVEEKFEVLPLRLLNSGRYLDDNRRQFVPAPVLCPNLLSSSLLYLSVVFDKFFFIHIFLYL